MATFTKIPDFVEDVAEGVHNFATDSLRIALSNTAPSSETNNPLTSGNGVLANVTQISYANYTDSLTSDRTLEGVTSNESGGVYTLDADNFSITASGGAIADFRYIYLYNDTPVSPADPLICVWDNGSPISISDGSTRNINFNASGILTIS